MVVYNARHRVYVTEQDDKKSVSNDSRHCAVAVAIGRQLEWSSHVDVNSQRIRLLDPENRGSNGLEYTRPSLSNSNSQR